MAGDLLFYRGHKKYSGRDHRQRIAIGEMILAGRNNGRTLQDLADEHGISVPSVRRYMDLALATRVAPTADLFRRQQNDRLDQTQREITANLEAANRLAVAAGEAQNFSLLERAISMRSQQIALQLRLDERRARLNGLDMPVQAEVRVTQVDPVDAEMAEMIREAKMRAAGREAMTDG